MIGVSYSAMGMLAIAIHCIINRDILFSKKQNDTTKNMQYYRRFLWGILAYYVTDTLWGVLDGMGLVEALRADTVVYYIAMSVAVVLWCDYLVAYLEQNNRFGKALRYFGRAFITFEILALVVNFFNHCFFWFDEGGNYHAGPVRYIALYVQVGMFAVATIQAAFVTLRTQGKQKRRHLAISMFSASMILAIVAQIFYPMLPIYSIGYLIGACFLHIFVEEDEKAEQVENIQKQMDIISSMAGIFFCSYYVDMRDRTFIEIDNKIPENDNFIGKSGDAVTTLDKVCKVLVRSQYFKEMQEFTNLDTLNERLDKSKYYISSQFESLHLGWAEGYLVASDRDEDGNLKHVIWAIRTINDEKQKEEKLLYNSYIDELTGLYNRKMYSEDTTENVEKFMKDDLIYVAMDINGLKVVNDTLGHAAGDELIKGAAKCMKEAMGTYGRIYRTGGDEFVAMLNANKAELMLIKERLDEITSSFKGEFIESISISCGYVIKKDNPSLSMEDIEKLADKNMYLAKKAHYSANGVDRRAIQQNAYKALCALYSKILMINLTQDKYRIISMDDSEQSVDKGFAEGIFDWLENFAQSGQVHEDDRGLYLAKTNRDFLINYFKQDKSSLSFTYRRMMNGEYKAAEMEMIPADDYTDDNQSLYLYVKEIDK